MYFSVHLNLEIEIKLQLESKQAYFKLRNKNNNIINTTTKKEWRKFEWEKNLNLK